MTVRSVVLTASLVALTALPAWSQTRPRPGTTGASRNSQSTPPRTNVIDRHERAKEEAQSAYQKGDYQHSLTLMNSVLAEAPRDDVALYFRASARVELGRRNRDPKQLRDGVTDARSAISIKNRDNALYYLPYLSGMSGLSEIEGRPDHAEVAVKVAEQVMAVPSVKGDDKANILYQLGVAHTALKQPDAAVQDFEQALRLSPNHLGAHMGSAEAYLQAGNKEKAAFAYDRAISAFSRMPIVHNNRGMFRHKQGDLTGAVTDFTRALELDSTYYVASTNRGVVFLSLGDVAAAENDFTASLAANPNQDSVYSFRGAARLAQGKLNPALSDFTRLVERSPKNAVGWSDLAFARFFAGDYKAASAAFEQSAVLNSSLRYLNPWRYWAMVLSGQPEAKIAEFAKAAGVDPKSGDWVDGLTAFAMGTIGEEELKARKATDNPKLSTDQTCEAEFFLALKLSREGKDKEAAEHFDKALATGSRHLSAYRGAQFVLKRFDTGG